MTINPKDNPQETLKLTAKYIQASEWAKAKQLMVELIKKNHFDYGLKLAKFVSKPPITSEKSQFLIDISHQFIATNKLSYLKEIASYIISSTGNKSDPTILKIKSLIQNSSSNQKDSSKTMNNVDIYSLSTKGNIQESRSQTQTSEDSVSKEEKESFNSFYRSFLTEDIKSLLVTSEKGSPLGQYSVHITKEYIDFHKVEGEYHKKYMYYFDDCKLTINKELKPEYVLKKFFKIMGQVSKDVKQNFASIMQEIF